MNILDEDLLHKITYSPECQATFQKYRKELTQRVIFGFIGLILLVVGAPALVALVERNLKPNESSPAVPFYTVTLLLFVLLVFMLQRAMKDLASKKLDITKDVFVELRLERQTSNTKSSSSTYVVELRGAGVLDIPPKRIRRIAKGTEVYVIRTEVTKLLLDIIPVEVI